MLLGISRQTTLARRMVRLAVVCQGHSDPLAENSQLLIMGTGMEIKELMVIELMGVTGVGEERLRLKYPRIPPHGG